MSDSKYTFQTDPSCGTYDDWVKKNGDELIETIYRSMHEAMQNTCNSPVSCNETCASSEVVSEAQDTSTHDV